MVDSYTRSADITSKEYHTHRQAMAKDYDHLFTVLLIGDRRVGKTCILFRYTDSVYLPTITSTIGIDVKFRRIELDGKRIKLQLWDTIVSGRYRSMTNAYYRGGLGIVVVYDVTNEKSFDNITNWIHNTEERAPEDVERILIGNKCDMQERKVEREKGENLAREHGFLFFETSAKENINVEEAFEFLARSMKAKADAKPRLPESIDQQLSIRTLNNKLGSPIWPSCSLI